MLTVRFKQLGLTPGDLVLVLAVTHLKLLDSVVALLLSTTPTKKCA